MANLWSRKLLSLHNPIILQQVRNKWYNKIKVNIYPSLAERLEEKDETRKDPELHAVVNIGFAVTQKSRKELLSQRLERVKTNKQNADLEKLAKKRQLKIDLDAVQEEWENTVAPAHLKVLADHYGIFKDLFGNAFFFPQVYLDIAYEYDSDHVSYVYRGNTIKPKEAAVQPTVRFSSKPEDLWTLILTNPDGNLYENGKECLHWFVGNIPGGDVSKGEIICDYLQPFPPKGIGYQRMVFLLYKQDHHIDFSSHQRQTPCLQLQDRTFSTLEFYRELQDEMTPAGVGWFQTDWDTSLTDVFHNKLNMKEPIYEYDFPPPFITEQKFFPKRRPFNIYLDMYRDPKEISKEILLKRLKKLNPLEREPPPLQFPAAVPIDQSVKSWLKRDIKKERLGTGKYRDLFRGRNRPPQIMDEHLTERVIEYEPRRKFKDNYRGN